MRKKYVVACNDKEKEDNYQYITKKYDRDAKKKNRKLDRHYIISLLQSLRLLEPYYSFDEGLCKLYIKELELYYLNNNFCKRRLQVRKAYLIKRNERHYGIILPIFLSLIASIIYGILSGHIWDVPREVANMVYNISWKFFDFTCKYEGGDYINICKLYAQLMIIAILFIVSMLLFVLWTTVKSIYIISAIFGGSNFSKATIKQYEIDYIEELISCDEYFNIVKVIKFYSDEFFDVIKCLIYNMVIKNGFASVENIINELGKN